MLSDIPTPFNKQSAQVFLLVPYPSPLYLAHYIESLGTGTLDVIRLCRKANFPIPDFVQRGNQFVVTLWRNWLTKEFLSKWDRVEQLEQT